MDDKLKELMDEFKCLEKRIGDEIIKKQIELRYKIDKGKVRFEKEQLEKFKDFKKGLIRYLYDSSFLTILTSPFIYFMLVPCIFLDFSVSIYQAVCFPIYRIPKVRRGSYIVMDRHKLKYLNQIERLNCSYCSYFNGVVSYVREVASRTEQYWCPIRHALRVKGFHSRYYKFLAYGDVSNYYERLEKLRDDLRGLKD